MKYYLLLFCFACIPVCQAQDFAYTLSIDSSSLYSNLTDPVVLSGDSTWLPKYEITPGFSDSSGFSGKFVLETNGFLVYNQVANSAVMAFNGFHSKVDSNAVYSQLSYLITGTAGSKILEVEFKNVGQSEDPKELLSYQVWVRENGVIELRMGPNSYDKLPGDTLIDSAQVVHIGLVNRNMDKTDNGLFVSGRPQQPVSSPLNGQHPELAFLRTIPKKGYRYIFTPTTH